MSAERPSESSGMCGTTAWRRLAFALAFVTSIALGLASRRYAASLPTFLADYAGDSLWAAMIYSGLGMLAPIASPVRRTVIALTFCFAIEVSQLYHRPWIDAIRSTRLGGLVLGSGFLWSDLVCYSAGVTAAFGIEQACFWRWRKKATIFPR